MSHRWNLAATLRRSLRIVATAALLLRHPLPARGADADVDVDVDVNNDEGFATLVAWFRSHGGFVDDRLAVSTEPGLNIRGVIASDDIPPDTVLIDCPRSLAIEAPGHCELCRAAELEIRRGNSSLWHPYLSLDDSANSRIPTVWDRRAVEELQGLPPGSEAFRHVEWYRSACNRGRPLDDVMLRSLLMSITRASDRGLIPIYDLLNHHNGLINTRLADTKQESLQVISSVAISKGEAIYNTYARAGWESEPELFNSYGFVEAWPQLWKWTDRKSSRDRTFALFPDQGWVAVEPDEKFTVDFGNRRVPLETWRDRVSEHNARVVWRGEAREFSESASSLLESLPTTVEEDEALLASAREELIRMERAGTVDAAKRLLQLDVISAIEYRTAFKKALRLAANISSRGTLFKSDDEEL